MTITFKKRVITICSLAIIFLFTICGVSKTYAMPFYNLKPKPLEIRSSFTTSFSTSSEERKHNIRLCSKSLDNVFLDIGEEFSFNKTVGERTTKRGYKIAKVIVGGNFVDGIGGGICQVSTTLYNAVLLSGLKITEYHPHSLQVGYVPPSFDAMVSSNGADLKFINNTDNPVIINSSIVNDKIKITITGEKSEYTYLRQSVIKEYVEPEAYEVIIDDRGEYPELYEGEFKIIKYAKQGVKSEGRIVKLKDGKPVGSYTLRKDSYSPIRGTKIAGTKKIEKEEVEMDNDVNAEIINLNCNNYKKPFDNRKNL